jgi:hypothetical protein
MSPLFFAGWHNRFNTRVNKSHPNVWHFIGTLKKEEVIFRQQLLHAKSGSARKKKEKVYFLQEKLNTLANRFEESEMNVQEYLQGLSLLVAKDIKMKK